MPPVSMERGIYTAPCTDRDMSNHATCGGAVLKDMPLARSRLYHDDGRTRDQRGAGAIARPAAGREVRRQGALPDGCSERFSHLLWNTCRAADRNGYATRCTRAGELRCAIWHDHVRYVGNFIDDLHCEIQPRHHHPRLSASGLSFGWYLRLQSETQTSESVRK